MPLPERDFNQEIEKTRGIAHMLEAAVKELLGDQASLADPGCPKMRGLVAFAEVLADRLDDLCVMNDDEQFASRERARGIQTSTFDA